MTQFDHQLNSSGGAWLADSEHLMCQHLASPWCSESVKPIAEQVMKDLFVQTVDTAVSCGGAPAAMGARGCASQDRGRAHAQ